MPKKKENELKKAMKKQVLQSTLVRDAAVKRLTPKQKLRFDAILTRSTNQARPSTPSPTKKKANKPKV